MREHRRAVITGLGVLSAAGEGKGAFWAALKEGRSGVAPMALVDPAPFASKIAGEVKGFDARRHLGPGFRAQRHARSSQLAAVAARMALDDAGWPFPRSASAAPLGIYLGISLAGFDVIQREMERYFEKGAGRMTPGAVHCIPLAAAALVSETLGTPSRLMSISNTCVGGLDAVALAARVIEEGGLDIAIAGGTDAPIVGTLVGGFCAAGMLCTRNADPAGASRPFDVRHERGVLAEGSAFVVIESETHARARGATIYMEVGAAGHARDSGAAPCDGLATAVRMAMNNNGILPGDLSAVCTHGPSDVQIDRAETRIMREVLGRHAYRIPMPSIKGVTGNPLAAGGAMQTVAAALMITEGVAHPTANLTEPDPDCDLDYVPGRARPADLDRVLINAHGMGGVNSALVVRRWSSG